MEDKKNNLEKENIISKVESTDHHLMNCNPIKKMTLLIIIFKFWMN